MNRQSDGITYLGNHCYQVGGEFGCLEITADAI